ncbi:MAG: metal-dependent transcriptional regulator, partial [Planctomycetaceae bacterium]
MPSLTVENYLKTALQISMKTGADWVSPGKLALALDVSPGTVTSMLKTLDDADLAVYKPYEGVCLTDAGQRLALRMLRRHRVIETFLVETLKLSWDQVHVEAENMEHAVSDLLIDRMDEFLGLPDCDPHGAPIPAPDGHLRSRHDSWQPLSECTIG